MRRPCNNCPWRKDAPREHWAPDHLTTIFRTCQDDGNHIMLCHKANALPKARRGRLVCQGWVRVLGFHAIGVRLAAMAGRVTKQEVEDKSGPALFRSFAAMLHANRVRLPRRNRRR